jgi:hypothetical protein
MGTTAMKVRNTLVAQLFEAAGKGNEAFIEALRHLTERERSVLKKRAVMVKEPAIHYGARSTSDLDNASCSVGAALHEVMAANGWTKKLAASKLKVSETAIDGLLAEMMPLTGKTVRAVTRFLCDTYSGASEQALTDCLLNGLHFWELKHSGPSYTRIAARRKGPPDDKKKP